MDEFLKENYTWLLLRNEIRRTPEMITVRLEPNQDFFSNEQTTLIMMMGDREFVRRPFDNNWLITQDEGFLRRFMMEEIQKEIDRRLEGVDWSTYFYTYEDSLWKKFLALGTTTEEEMRVMYGINGVAERSDTKSI